MSIMRADHLVVLANAACPHCRHALDVLTELAQRESVAISALDVHAHPEAARAWAAESSPFLVFDAGGERYEHAGLPNAVEFHALVEGPLTT